MPTDTDPASSLDPKAKGKVRLLVLTRKPGQETLILTAAGLIRVKQLGRSRIAIEAPPGARILRAELVEEDPD